MCSGLFAVCLEIEVPVLVLGSVVGVLMSQVPTSWHVVLEGCQLMCCVCPLALSRRDHVDDRSNALHQERLRVVQQGAV